VWPASAQAFPGWPFPGASRKLLELLYAPAARGCPTRFELVLHLPADLSEEQADKLRVIAAKCPIHRTLDGEVMFSERIERAKLPA